VLLLASACGKNQPLTTQEDQRAEFGPEIPGRWMTNCKDKQIHRLSIDEKKITFERTDFYDEECQEQVRTTRQGGSYALSHNYKTGVNNSIAVVADQEVRVTLHTDTEVFQQTNALALISEEHEKPIKPEDTVDLKKTQAWENRKIRAAKLISPWKQDEEKALNRLQLLKLQEKPYLLKVTRVAEQGSLFSLRYEVDNGYLQITGPEDFARVYHKQP
jgi:hypothetical protein